MGGERRVGNIQLIDQIFNLVVETALQLYILNHPNMMRDNLINVGKTLPGVAQAEVK